MSNDKHGKCKAINHDFTGKLNADGYCEWCERLMTDNEEQRTHLLELAKQVYPNTEDVVHNETTDNWYIILKNTPAGFTCQPIGLNSYEIAVYCLSQSIRLQELERL